MPYPETDGIRYFFAPRYAADSPHKRGQPYGCPLEALRRKAACPLPKRCKKAIRTRKPLVCAPVCSPACYEKRDSRTAVPFFIAGGRAHGGADQWLPCAYGLFAALWQGAGRFPPQCLQGTAVRLSPFVWAVRRIPGRKKIPYPVSFGIRHFEKDLLIKVK